MLKTSHLGYYLHLTKYKYLLLPSQDPNSPKADQDQSNLPHPIMLVLTFVFYKVFDC